MTKVKTQNKSIKKRSIADDFGLHANNFSLLHSPGRQLCPYGKELFGANLISNGDFRDFTMEDDADTIGHYIFDKSYEREDKNKYIGSERGGSESAVSLTSWINDPTYPWEVFSTNNDDVSLENTTGCGIARRTFDTVSGKKYRITMDDLAVSGSTIYLRVSVSMSLTIVGDLSTVINGESGETSFVFTSTNTGTNFVGFRIDTGYPIGAVSCTLFNVVELPAKSLTPSGFSNGFEDEYTTDPSNPAYQNGGQLYFNGSTEYFNGGNIHNFGADQDFSIEAWIKCTDDGTAKTISGKYESGTEFWLFFITETGLLRGYVYTDIGNRAVNSIDAVDDGEWHHVAFVADRDDLGHIYIDGFSNNTADISPVSSGICTNSTDFTIGAYADGTNPFTGYISEVRVSDVARSAIDILRSYGMAKGLKPDDNYQGITNQFKNVDFTQQFRKSVTNGRIFFDIGGLIENGALYRIDTTFNNPTSGLYQIYNTGSTAWTLFDAGALRTITTYVQGNASTFNALTYYALLGDQLIYLHNVSVHKVLNAVTNGFVEDFSKGGAKYGNELATGTLTSTYMYVITATEVGHFGSGLVVGDYFVSNGTETCDSNNKVKQVTNGNHGLMQNDMENDQPTYPYALEYNGVDQSIKYGVINIDKDDPFILFAWVYINIDGVPRTILCNQDNAPTYRGFVFYIDVAEKLGAIFRSTTSNKLGKYVNTALSEGWHFVTVSYDGSLSASGMKLYLESVEITETTNVGDNLTSTTISPISIYSGAREGEGNFHNNKIGDTGIILFDGNAGRPNNLPSNYEDWINRIYNATKWKYKN